MMSSLDLDLTNQKKILILNSVFDRYHNSSNLPKNGELIYKCINDKCLSHAKRYDKFCINVFKESAHCWVCGIKIKNISYVIKEKNDSYYREWLEVRSKKEYFNGENLLKKPEIVYYDSIIDKTESVYKLPTDHPARLYLQNKRFISFENSVKFNLRYVKKLQLDQKIINNAICIPSHSIEGINFLFFRSIFPNSSFKYNSNSPKENIIFNDLYINWNKDIVLTEGVFDTLRIFPYIQAIPILGSYLNENTAIFKKILKHRPKKVYVCLDPEAINMQIKILDRLHNWGINVYSILLHNSDLGASTEEDIQNAIKNSKEYNKTLKLQLSLMTL